MNHHQLDVNQVCLLPMIVSEAVARYSEQAAQAPCEELAAYWAAEAAKAVAIKDALNRAVAIQITTA